MIDLSNIFEKNAGAILSLIIFVITQAAVVARSIWVTLQTAKKVDHLEQLLTDHLLSSTLHRPPDFELRLTHLNDLMEEIRADVKKLLRKHI